LTPFDESLKHEIFRSLIIAGTRCTISSAGYIDRDGQKIAATINGKPIYRAILSAFAEPPTQWHTNVHHINGNHKDNRLANLMWANEAEHAIFHHIIRAFEDWKPGTWARYCEDDPTRARRLLENAEAFRIRAESREGQEPTLTWRSALPSTYQPAFERERP